MKKMWHENFMQVVFKKSKLFYKWTMITEQFIDQILKGSSDSGVCFYNNDKFVFWYFFQLANFYFNINIK